MRVRAKKLLFLGGCVVAMLVLPAAAQAASVRLVDQTDERSGITSSEVVYDATPGEANRVDAAYDGTRFVTVTDAVAITPGRGCTRPNPAVPTSARCEITAEGGSAGITVNAGDGNDFARVTGDAGSLRGGDGNDELIVLGDRASDFTGGPGNDHIVGGDGFDVIDEGASASGSDFIEGGGGDDQVLYSHRRNKIHADLSGDAGDGELGENDRIARDVETLVGGHADDRLTGNSGPNALLGGGGSDILEGAGAADLLAAGDSEFGPSRSHTHDRLNGGSGRDELLGSAGPNRLSGGGGADEIAAAGGNDRISDRDGKLDAISCGRGRDRVRLDGFDFTTDRCERISRSFSPAGVPMALELSSNSRRRALVKVGCPSDAPRVCHGRVVIKRGRRGLGSRKFRVRHGHTKEVVVAVPASATGKRVRVTVRSLDRLGRIRTVSSRFTLAAF
ncbi:MAG TPA: calcium-binding protein [Thermoleophilaceae bacterium]